MLISELPVQESKKVVSLKYKNSLFKGKIEEFYQIHLDKPRCHLDNSEKESESLE